MKKKTLIFLMLFSAVLLIVTGCKPVNTSKYTTKTSSKITSSSVLTSIKPTDALSSTKKESTTLSSVTSKSTIKSTTETTKVSTTKKITSGIRTTLTTIKSTTEPTTLTVTLKEKQTALGNKSCSELEVVFLNLISGGKQQIGDSIYIGCDDVDIIIDGGIQGVGTETVVPFLKEKVTDKKIELIITTHNDNDHIGGMVGLSNKEGILTIKDFTYEYIVDSGVTATTAIYSKYLTALESAKTNGGKYCSYKNMFEGTSTCPNEFYLGTLGVLKILDTKMYDLKLSDVNEYSVPAILIHGEKKILLCGDAESKAEDVLIKMNLGHVDVFKANHHGSPTSNKINLLDSITPDYVIISASESNSYNLPKKTIVARFALYTQNVYATFLSGNITVISDGTNIFVNGESELTKVQESNWYYKDIANNPRP